MSNFLNLVKKHLVISVAILLGAIAVLVTGISFLATSISYSIYSKDYDKMKADLLINTPQPPESIVSTKSNYQNKYLLTARDAEIELDEGDSPTFAPYRSTSWEVANGFKKGGSITYKVNAAATGMSDIDVYLGFGEVTGVTIDNLIDYITIKVNGFSVNTVDFDLPSNGSLQQLVLKNTKLVAGENTLEFATTVSSNNDFVMPAIPAVTFITEAELA